MNLPLAGSRSRASPPDSLAAVNQLSVMGCMETDTEQPVTLLSWDNARDVIVLLIRDMDCVVIFIDVAPNTTLPSRYLMSRGP